MAATGTWFLQRASCTKYQFLAAPAALPLLPLGNPQGLYECEAQEQDALLIQGARQWPLSYSAAGTNWRVQNMPSQN